MSVAGINGTADYPVYTPGKAKGYGTEQDAWIKGKNQSIFDAKV